MKSAHHPVERERGEYVSRVSQDIHYAGVRTGSKHHDTPPDGVRRT